MLYGVGPHDIAISTDALGPGDLGEKATKITVINVQHLKSEKASGPAAIVVL